MKIKKSILLGVTALSFGTTVASATTTAQAYSTYRTIPRAIRGYYIGHHRISMITGHRIVYGLPQADAYSYRVTSVTRKGHYYRIHTYLRMPNRINITFKVKHTSRYKLRIDQDHLDKVSKSLYYWYANHGVTG